MYFIEDILLFKRNFETAITYISKLRGRSRDGPVIRKAFFGLLEEQFPDVFESPSNTNQTPIAEEEEIIHKKRSRVSDSSVLSAPASAVTPEEIKSSVVKKRGRPGRKKKSVANDSETDDDEEDSEEHVRSDISLFEYVRISHNNHK